MKTSTKKLDKVPDYLQNLIDNPQSEIVLEQLRVKEYSNKIPVIKGQRNTIIPWSGGLDSTTALLMALESGNIITTVNFNYGQSYFEKEESAIKKLQKLILEKYPYAADLWEEHVSIDISWANNKLKDRFKGEWQHIFPLRNFLIIMESSLLAKQNQFTELWFSCIQGEIPYSGGDKSIVFLNSTQKIWAFKNVLLVTPLIALNKADIVRWALGNINRYEIILKTVSCFSGKENTQCGECLACFNRLVGFNSAGKPKDCGFIPIYSRLKPFIDKYNEAFSKENYYSKTRKEDILQLIKILNN